MAALSLPVLSVAEMRAADAAATVPASVLVQRAGRAVANQARAMLGGSYGRRVVVVAGKGNNGADGRVAGAVLESWGASVRVVDPGEGFPACDLVIDGAFGTGFHGSYSSPGTGATPILAIDIPSGVDGDTGVACAGAVRASATITMAAWKTGLLLGDGPAHAGKVTVADIGLAVGAPSARLVDVADLAWLPRRDRGDNKWSRAVFVVAGSPGMQGAARLCTDAALRAGVGMCRAGSPGVDASDQPASEVVHISLPADGWEATVLESLSRFHALVVGPGLGKSAAGVVPLVAGADVPTVVDADGLNALDSVDGVSTAIAKRPTDAPVVLTPHEGEFARLTGSPVGRDRLGAVRAVAAATGAVVLLKGPTTVVADPTGAVLLAASGDARLATAGTGDVLAGLIGALMAAGLPGLQAAGLGAFVHGEAAQLGRPVGLVAGDLPPLIAEVFGAS